MVENEIRQGGQPSEELLEESEYSSKSEFSKATLTQVQITKCLDLRSKEMKPGFTTFVIDKNGEAKPQQINDSRKEYISSVDALLNLLSPETDINLPRLVEQYQGFKKISFNKYSYKERIGRKYVKTPNGEKAIWVYSDNIFIPHKGTPIMCLGKKENTNHISYNTHEWDMKIDAYWDELVFIADELFAELNKLIHTLDYFKGKTGL